MYARERLGKGKGTLGSWRNGTKTMKESYKKRNARLNQEEDKGNERKEQIEEGCSQLFLTSRGFITPRAITAAGDRL